MKEIIISLWVLTLESNMNSHPKSSSGGTLISRKLLISSSNEFKFAELPAVNPEYLTRAATFRQPFSGRPEETLIQAKGGHGIKKMWLYLTIEKENIPKKHKEEAKERDPLADSDEELDIRASPKSFTELDRLAFVVRSIDLECAALPVGAVKLASTHEIRYNDSFKGLGIAEASDLKNYQHFRRPLTEEKKEFIRNNHMMFLFLILISQRRCYFPP